MGFEGAPFTLDWPEPRRSAAPGVPAFGIALFVASRARRAGLHATDGFGEIAAVLATFAARDHHSQTSNRKPLTRIHEVGPGDFVGNQASIDHGCPFA